MRIKRTTNGISLLALVWCIAAVECDCIYDPPDPARCVLTPELDFGSVDVGGTKDLTVRVSNTGDVPLCFSLNRADPDCGDFSVLELVHTGLCSTTGEYGVPAQEDLDFTVRFQPSSAGMRACEVRTGPTCGDMTWNGEGVTVGGSGAVN